MTCKVSRGATRSCYGSRVFRCWGLAVLPWSFFLGDLSCTTSGQRQRPGTSLSAEGFIWCRGRRSLPIWLMFSMETVL